VKANNCAELIPPELLAEVEAVAAAEQRPAHEMVREAVERYLREHQATAAEAAEPASAREAHSAGSRSANSREPPASHPAGRRDDSGND
jgi:hypothetical protein